MGTGGAETSGRASPSGSARRSSARSAPPRAPLSRDPYGPGRGLDPSPRSATAPGRLPSGRPCHRRDPCPQRSRSAVCRRAGSRLPAHRRNPSLPVVHGLGGRYRHGPHPSGLTDGQLGDRAEAPPLEEAPGARRHDHRHISEPAQRREVSVIAV